MTDNDRKYAIECIDYQLEDGYIDLGCHDQDELEVVKEAINKQVPQNVVVEPYFYGENYYCPSCRGYLGGDHNDLRDIKFCVKCGQRIIIKGN